MAFKLDRQTRWDSPIFPIAPGFKPGGDLDIRATLEYVKYLYNHGAMTVMTTAGTSQFNLLSTAEIFELSKHIIAFTNTLKMDAVIGLPITASSDTINTIRALRDWLNQEKLSQPAAVMVAYPDRYYSFIDLMGWVERIRETVKEVLPETDLWLHALPIRKGTGGEYKYAPFDIKALMEYKLIQGVKEESMDSIDLAYRISRVGIETGGTVCLAGGSMRRAALAPGTNGVTWLTGVGSLFPEVELAAYKAWKARDFTEFRKYQLNYEDQIFGYSGSFGWHPFMRCALAELGVLPSVQREPFPELDSYMRGAVSRCITTLRDRANEDNLDLGPMYS